MQVCMYVCMCWKTSTMKVTEEILETTACNQLFPVKGGVDKGVSQPTPQVDKNVIIVTVVQ